MATLEVAQTWQYQYHFVVTHCPQLHQINASQDLDIGNGPGHRYGVPFTLSIQGGTWPSLSIKVVVEGKVRRYMASPNDHYYHIWGEVKQGLLDSQNTRFARSIVIEFDYIDLDRGEGQGTLYSQRELIV